MKNPMFDIRAMFPIASDDTVALNQHLSDSATVSPKPKQNEPQPIVATRRGKMNKTEAEYALILEAMKRKGEIMWFGFESITLRWNGITYTPDFTVIYPTMQLGFHEVKGGFIRGHFERAVERFRHARTYFTYFDFQLHQKTKEGWKQII